MCRFLVFIVFVCSSVQVLAIDLYDALAIAYDNNNKFQIIRRNFLNEMETFPQALAGFLPNIIASLESTDSRSKSLNPTITRKSNIQQNALIIDQSIFNGWGDVSTLKAAQLHFYASRENFYSEEQKIILEIIQAYLACIENDEKYHIAEISVLHNKTLLSSYEEKLNVGEATNTDVASAVSALAAAETSKLSAFAALQRAKADFVKVFGTEPVDLVMPVIANDLPDSLDALLQMSEQMNPAIHALKHSGREDKTNEMAAKSSLLPKVNFRIQSATIHGSNRDLGQPSRSTTSTLSVQIPIFSKGGSEYSKIRQAKNKARMSAIKLNEKIKENNSDCISYWENFQAAKSKIISATRGLEAAQIAYNGALQEEALGSKSTLEVLNAENRLNQAQLMKVSSNMEYVIAAYQIKALIGQLTAKSLALKVQYFNIEKEFKRVKVKVIGS
jgi:outer membrane protein